MYNIRFANDLDFGNQASVVARDASRLVKRFKADWMTSGRRPAGICGACLVIAARMSDFLRTPEEVAQVVKVSPLTIKKRLVEFAQTAAATKTVEEWRSLTDADLETPDQAELPPIMKKEKERLEKERIKREREETAGAEAAENATPTPKRQKRKADNALQDAADDVDGEDGVAGEDGEDETMDPLSKEDYVVDIQKAGDNSTDAKAVRAREKRQLLSSMRKADGKDDDDDDEEELVAIADEDGQEDEDDTAADDNPAVFGGFRNIPAPPDWSDKKAVYAYIEEHFFHDQDALYGGNKPALHARIDRWLQGRTAEEVIGEMRRVEWAHHEREWFAKHHHESQFEDLDDDELDMYWVMDDDERQARARMWLSHNGKWLEEDKERQEKKAAYNRAHGIDPNKPKSKKRRTGAGPARKGPFPSARDAIDSFATQKKFSSRINMDAIRKLGSGSMALPRASQYAGLQSMGDDDKSDDGDEGYYSELHCPPRNPGPTADTITDEKYDDKADYEEDDE